MRTELRKGDGACWAGGLVVGPEDHAAGSERDAEGEESSPAGEVKGDDVIAVAGEWMRRRKENEALDVECRGSSLHSGEPESQRAAVGVADDDGALQAERVGEVGDESSEGLGAEVEDTGDGLGGEDVDSDDAAVAGKTGDEVGQGLGRGEELVEDEEGSFVAVNRGCDLEIVQADAVDGDLLVDAGYHCGGARVKSEAGCGGAEVCEADMT